MSEPKAFRRFTQHKPTGNPLTLAVDHPAVVDGRTYFRRNVVGSDAQIRLLKSGGNSVKIGSHVTKGALKGAPIFTLTLEERLTCPKSCAHWRDCYGNKMHWPKRIVPDDGFLPRLEAELHGLHAKHGRFLVRLHVLGDFYSVAYVEFWSRMLRALLGLHIFGYTARRKCEIAAAINCIQGPRCSIRTSDDPSPLAFRSITVDDPASCGDAILCPAQTDKTDCCGTCALCWSTPRAIAFLRH